MQDCIESCSQPEERVGERAELVLVEQYTRPIETARFAFLETTARRVESIESEPLGDEETLVRELQERRPEDRMPAVDMQRFGEVFAELPEVIDIDD